MTQRWYALRTKPHSEYLAASALERDGFHLFFPRLRSPRSQQGHRYAPLFPGYIFLRFDMETQNVASVHALPGILGWVRFGGAVPHVPDEVIADQAKRVEEINSKGGLWSRFQPGDRVRVVSGNVDRLGQVLEEPRSPQARVRVLLDFMGRMVSAQVAWHNLHTIQEEPDTEGSRIRGRRTRGRGRWIRGVGPRAAAAGVYS